MTARFEYKIVRLDANRETIGTGDKSYHQTIHQYADEGWRLSDVYSPPGMATVWLDLIFERQIESEGSA